MWKIKFFTFVVCSVSKRSTIMNLIFLLSFIGLVDFSTSSVHDVALEKKHLEHLKRHHHQTRDHTTEASPLNVNETIKNYEGLNLLHDHDMQMVGFANVTHNVAYIVKNSGGGTLSILIDSKSGEILTFSDSSQVSIISDNKDSKGDILEVVSKILDKYIFKNESIPGNSTDFKSDSEKALGILDEVYLHLGHPKDEERKKFRSFKTLDAISKTLDRQLLGPLKGILNGKTPHPLRQNLNRFLTILMGLEKFFNQANGGLKAILAQGLKFEIDPLFNNKNGASVFTYILRVTAQKFELGKLWQRLWLNWSELLKIIQMLGGGETKNGVDETFALTLHVWEALNWRLSITDLVKFLTDASCEEHWSKEDDADYKEVILDLKDITDQQSKKYDGSGKFNPFIVFFSNFTANTLISHNINVSDIIAKYHKRDLTGGFKWVMDTSLSVFNPKLYTDLFFNTFTSFLNSSSDPNALKRLVPGVSVDQFTKNGTLWENINKAYDVDKKLKNGTDPNAVLKDIPAFSEFSKTCKDALGNGIDYSKFLKGSSITDYLNSGGIMTNSWKWSVDSVKHIFGDSGKFLEQIFVDPFKGFMGFFGGSQESTTSASSGVVVTKDEDGNVVTLNDVTSSTTPSTTTTEGPCDESSTTTKSSSSKRNLHNMKHHHGYDGKLNHEHKLKHVKKHDISENHGNMKRNSHNHHNHDLEKKHHAAKRNSQRGQNMEKKHHEN